VQPKSLSCKTDGWHGARAILPRRIDYTAAPSPTIPRADEVIE
jgi:hypothetical protein